MYNYEKHRRWKWEEIQARLYHVNKRVLAVTNAQNLGAQFIESVEVFWERVLLLFCILC
ncbi:ABC transporter ATP-binding protein [Bacteroides pyogenes JCM 6292]|uniref:ABC transporter ATP-binding protein n=1 Tax=Bacteroides pyogenes JCM 6292 TaxID=1235809 RepID=W4PCU2_9BACE|nr:ABC transporter ATP-binding protein [Bacteroides pyogenes JCM 6292]